MDILSAISWIIIVSLAILGAAYILNLIAKAFLEGYLAAMLGNRGNLALVLGWTLTMLLAVGLIMAYPPF